MFERIRYQLAQLLSPARQAKASVPLSDIQQRLYAMAKASRLTGGWGTQTLSEDAELSSSLSVARARSRQLIRDSAYAKRAKVVIQNNIVGAGIGLQANVMTTRGQLNERVNDEIETVWDEWTYKEYCHTGRSLCFQDLERVVMGQVFEAGECFLRKHLRRGGEGQIPFALELIEAERIADDLQPAGIGDAASHVRLGVEVDRFGAPINYLIRTLHPGELRIAPGQTNQIERIPASDILHIRVIDRWPQTRAMPWMHAAARKLNDMDGLTEAEITAARAAACYMGFIELPNAETKYGDPQEDGSVQTELEPATIERLNPGEKFTFAAPNRPNAQLDPFMRMMLREVAAGVGCSYEGLSRDYSQSNYSSSRLALIDDRDLWRTLQQWFIREVRIPIHRAWLQQAVLAGAIPSISLAEYGANPRKFEAAHFKARGWTWVDPTKEVQAYKEAVLAGFTTVTDVIAQTGSGRDLEDIMKEREHELKLMEQLGLVFSTDPATVSMPTPAATTVVAPDPNATDGTPTGNNALDETTPAGRAIASAESIARNHHA